MTTNHNLSVSDLLDLLEQEDPTTRKKGRGRRTKEDSEWVRRHSITAAQDVVGEWWVDPTLEKIVLIYERISSFKTDSDTFERQNNNICKMAQSMGLDITNAIRFQDEESAFHNVHRPGWHKLVSFVQRFEGHNQIIILTSEGTRLVRNREVAHRSFGILRRKKAQVLMSDMPSFDLQSGNFDMMLSVLIEMWQGEAAATSFRTKGGMVIRKNRGEYCGGGIPFGMITEKRQNIRGMKSYLTINLEPAGDFPARITMDGKVVDNPFSTEADLVREIYRRYAAGDPVSGVTSWLNSNLFPNPSREGIWSLQVVTSLLKNPHYTGRVVHKKQVVTDDEGNDLIVNPAIIDDEVFFTVQSLLSAGSQKHVRQNRYQLSGLLKCSQCGKSLVGRPHRKTERMYTCNQHYIKNPNCPLPNLISASSIEGFVYDLLVGLAESNPQFLEDLGKPQDVVDKNAGLRAQLEAELKTIEENLAAETNDRKIAGLKGERLFVTNQLKDIAADVRAAQVLSRVVFEGADQFKTLWDSGDKYNLSLALSALIDSIIIEPSQMHPKMNHHQLAKLGWKANLYRVSIKWANGVVMPMSDPESAIKLVTKEA